MGVRLLRQVHLPWLHQPKSDSNPTGSLPRLQLMPDIVDTSDTAAALYFDLQLRHQIGVRRLSSGIIKEMLKTLGEADRQLTSRLRDRLPIIAGGNTFKGIDFEAARLRSLLESVQNQRARLWAALEGDVQPDLEELVAHEVDFEQRILLEALPVRITLESVPIQKVRAATFAQPFGGGQGAARTLKKWFSDLSAVDQQRITSVVQQGVIQSKTIDQTVRDVVGTRAGGFNDGVLAISRRNAEAVVRTGINHISNVARESVWEANSKVISALRWTATLDGRTSAICRGRDGAATPVGDNPLPAGARRLSPPGARPPAHPNCRSLMIAILYGQGIADLMVDRPFVRDSRTRKFREKDFRAEAREALGSERWKSMSRPQRNVAIRARKVEWAERVTGRVPASTTYDEWLRRQPTEFQDEVLGLKKAKVFREGLHLDRFIDQTGRELTLKQLKSLGVTGL